MTSEVLTRERLDAGLDAALAAHGDRLDRWSLMQLAAIYGAVDLAAIDLSFKIAVPRLAGLYAAVSAAALATVSEYVWLKGALGGVSVVHDWRRTRLDWLRLLPSGRPAYPYFAGAPLGVKALIRDGLPPAEALRVSRGRSSQAISGVPHLASRQVTLGVARVENSVGVEWPALSSPPDTPPRVLLQGDVPGPVASYVGDVVSRFDAAQASPVFTVDDFRRMEDFANTAVSPPRAYLTPDGLRVGRMRAKWRRVPAPGACDFCLTLASRGGVYVKATVESTRRDGTVGGLDRYHFRCRCRGMLDFVGLPDLMISRDDWRRLSTRGGDGALPTFGIGGSRYSLQDFSYVVYDGEEPPTIDWFRAV